MEWIRLPKVNVIFAWYDLWVGAFWDSKKRLLYVFHIPTLGIVISFTRINKSQLNGFVKSDHVECTYNNSGNKFWYDHLTNHADIQEIKWSNDGISEIKIGGKWFWENDFKKSPKPPTQ